MLKIEIKKWIIFPCPCFLIHLPTCISEIGWEIWNYHYSIVSDLQNQQSCIAQSNEIKQTKNLWWLSNLYRAKLSLLRMPECGPCFPIQVHFLLCCLPSHFYSSSYRASLMCLPLQEGFLLLTLSREILVDQFLIPLHLLLSIPRMQDPWYCPSELRRQGNWCTCWYSCCLLCSR